MHTKTCASAVKIYLFFLFISLFAVSGCGLDVDFGGNNRGDGNSDVASEETIEGTIEDVPSEYEGKSFVVKACVVKGGIIEEVCRATEEDVSQDEEFSLRGNLDPEVELQIFEGENEDSPIGSRRIEVFPGAMIVIEDITIEADGRVVYDPEEANITFRGEVSDRNHNCTERGGNLDGRIDVTISSEGSETVTITVRLDGTEIFREDDPMCEQIASGRNIEVDGKLTNESKTIEADLIEIL